MSEAPERKESRLGKQTLPGPLPIRIILGPQNDFFSPEAIETLTNNPTQSPRRLIGWGCVLMARG
ncbi:MAG: hypothetical protein CM1200mP41_32570 [Gammaproteobacteria bacterium]|nr:MAG: hypothetical protein CM1200mP41_32570 [Gammaproteobacteria bacterium]